MSYPNDHSQHKKNSESGKKGFFLTKNT